MSMYEDRATRLAKEGDAPRMRVPIALVCAVIVGNIVGCLGEVPPFRGEGAGGGASSAASEATTTTTGTSTTTASSGATTTSSTGAGGSPAGSASSSTSSGSGCALEDLPASCDAALETIACADLSHDEVCDVAIECPDVECQLPVAVLLGNPPDGYCTTAEDSSSEVCLHCDDAGPGLALASPDDVSPVGIAAFAPGMPSVAKIRARGRGAFQLQWLVDADSHFESPNHTLSDEFESFDVLAPPSTAFELRVIPVSTTVVNDPLWMEVDCAYTVDLASGVAR